MRITNFPRKQNYISIKNKAAVVSGALSKSQARDAVLAYRRIQAQEALARKAWSDCTDFWDASKAFQLPTQSWIHLLGKLNKVAAQLALNFGISGAQEIIDFDTGDVLSQAKNLERLFESNKVTELAGSLKTVREETVRNQKQYEADRGKFSALNDRLGVVLSKLNADTALGLLALKNNKIALPKKSVVASVKMAEPNMKDEVKL